ncbi:PTS sugar transporter subunit IIA [Desulfotignum balticum]|uniref:PTS sugar transporter subunit IIA n=1 Tax=Desulfotignum balticum TaxID=115781 RepID=UPI0003F9C19F|nr:PTS sugar transporter subunit IIA [Desulfotignum balticum]
MNGNRADNFLRLIRRSQRGRLKIYLGYAAGVGKTYQMLLEGHRIMQDGVDLAVGVVETHGRAETEALLAGLPVIPRRKISYRGIVIEEMDLDAILERHPSVVLVDELAHTNVPGSKNAKRYQDVEELLAAGIHVISTLNIQHLESLYETVERATNVKVRERIPDRVVAEADQIVNVDITIEDLRRRLKEGKVYTKERIETALDHFFRPPNLEQLRELTLRELAAQIDSRRRDPLDQDIPSSPDQVMVALSSRGPNSEALLRYASRLAGRLNRNWYAVYVQTSQERPTVIDAATQRMLSNTLTLAQQLGATVFTYKGDDVVKTILQFAKEYRVGHIVIGSPGRKMPFWKRLRGGSSIVERLVIEGKGLTVVVLDTKAIREERPAVEKREPDKANPEEASQHHKDFARENKAVLSRMTALVWKDPLGMEEAIQYLLDSFRHIGKEQKSHALNSLLEREQQGGTLVGEDVAIPHARVDGISQPLIAIGVGTKGVQDLDSGRKAKIIVLLLSPIDPPEKHIETLGIISRMAADDLLRKNILAAKEPRIVREMIQDWAIKMENIEDGEKLMDQ